jgi:hypothetical protein
MMRRAALVLLLVGTAACSEPASTTAQTVPVASAPPVDACATAREAFEALSMNLDRACRTDDDCVVASIAASSCENDAVHKGVRIDATARAREAMWTACGTIQPPCAMAPQVPRCEQQRCIASSRHAAGPG